MMHPLDRPVGSDLSFQVAQLRRRRQELGTQALDSTNQTLHPLVTRPSCFDGFIADREGVVDSYQRETMRFPESKRK